jgi:DNA processing protein
MTFAPISGEGDDDLAFWVRLAQTPGLGSVGARALLILFGLPENIFCAGFDALRRVVPTPVALALSGPMPAATQALIDTTLAWLETPGNHVLTLADPRYPGLLLEIADPPLLLHLKGRIQLLQRPALAVVGSRNASAQGMANAEHFSHVLSDAGLTIVSGLALGIDAAAHRGGLRGAASTIAVIGTGADIVYPHSNRALADLIAEQGCIISEYALGMPALPGNFPRRNRLISGLARAVLVVEAAARSGSLITARMAAEQGRDVFAIPGSIHSALAKGCHSLIKQGARLVESADDVLSELQLEVQRFATGATASASSDAALADEVTDPEQQALLAALGHDPVDADNLAQRAGLNVANVTAHLLALELGGRVERLPGGLFQRNNK